MTLVMTHSGTLHLENCYTTVRLVLKRKTYRRFAGIEDAEGFIRAMNYSPCGSCFPGLNDRIAAEKVVAR